MLHGNEKTPLKLTSLTFQCKSKWFKEVEYVMGITITYSMVVCSVVFSTHEDKIVRVDLECIGGLLLILGIGTTNP